MLKIKKDMLLFDDGIKERLDFIIKYLNKEAVFENGTVVSIDKTNLHYVEQHRMSIKNYLFLFFNYDNLVCYKTLDTKLVVVYSYRAVFTALKKIKTFAIMSFSKS